MTKQIITGLFLIVLAGCLFSCGKDEKASYLSYNAYIQPSLQEEYPGIRIFGIGHVCRKNPITSDGSGES